MALLLTQSQQKAKEMLDCGYSVFLTGKPGTGKTEFAKAYCAQQEALGKKVFMTASTGLAASNFEEGRTIHSVLRYRPGIKKFDYAHCAEALQTADILFVDEVSQLNQAILEHLWRCLGTLRKPLQIIMVGDFFQLPPVRDPLYPFESPYWQSLNLYPCFLTEVVRQRDPKFKDMLELAMWGDPGCIPYFNTRTNQNWMDGAITLCALNADADSINRGKMSMLFGDSRFYEARGETEKVDFSKIRVEKYFEVKMNMRVMALRNDSSGNYQNGSLGIVIGMNDNNITVQFDSGKIVDISRCTYEMESKNKEETVTISQFPLRAGYAISIHKSQGQTFDAVNIVAPKYFAAGQLYVALSRARTVEGIHLENLIQTRDLITDPRVINYYQSLLNIGYAA